MSAGTQPDAGVAATLLAVTGFKGGAGKTTTVANLAVAAQRAGQRVLAIDADRQRSLSLWLDRRQKTCATPIASHSVEVRDAVTLVARMRPIYDLILIDLAGRDEAAVTEVIRVADFCLVPTRPSTLDADAAQRTVDALERLQKPYAVLINQAPPTSSSRTRAWAAFYDVRSRIVEPSWVARVAHQDAIAAGLGVMEAQPASSAAIEVLGTWIWLRARLGRLAREARDV